MSRKKRECILCGKGFQPTEEYDDWGSRHYKIACKKCSPRNRINLEIPARKILGKQDEIKVVLEKEFNLTD